MKIRIFVNGFLKSKDILVEAYHADLTTPKKTKVLKDFINNKIKVVVATIAFGMGIDKSNIKTNRLYQCKCGLKIDRDINAAKNIKYILERFSSKLCKKNSYGEYESIKYITKEFTKSILLDEKVKNFSSLLTEC